MKNKMLFDLGNMMLTKGRFEDARNAFTQYVEKSETEPPDESVAIALKDIGICFKKQGRLDEALNYYEQALSLARRLNLELEIADNISNMGVIYKNQAIQLQNAGDPASAGAKLKEAEKCYLEAKEIDRKTKNDYGLASDLNNLGIVYRHLQERSRAIGAYLESIKIAEKIGDSALIGKAEMNIGLIHGDSGNWDEDIVHMQKALLALAQGGFDQAYSIAQVKYNLAIAYFEKGDPRKARENFQEAGSLLEQLQISGTELNNNIQVYLEKCG